MKKPLLLTILGLFMVAFSFAQTPLKKVYNETIDPLTQIDSAVTKAQINNKNVICQVGGNWCIWCLRFADFITRDADIKQLIDDNYEYIHVNYSGKNSNPALMTRLNNPSRFGYPVFVVLDSTGKVIHIQDSSFLEAGQSYDKNKVLRFFKSWTPDAIKN